MRLRPQVVVAWLGLVSVVAAIHVILAFDVALISAPATDCAGLDAHVVLHFEVCRSSIVTIARGISRVLEPLEPALLSWLHSHILAHVASALVRVLLLTAIEARPETRMP